jgi:outer membrane receptor protein involved in Fe transport
LYATDLSRIEILKGPQGTLFGASSQAGTIRLITNKPDLTEFSVGAQVEYSVTRGGEDSHSEEGFINIPIIEDTLGFRMVAYNSHEGGFIDNIGATRQVPLDNPGLLPYAAAGIVPTTRVTADNSELVEDDFNDATYRGFRASALYKVNDDWDIFVQHTHQTLESEGIFEFEPDVSGNNDFNVQSFSPNFGEDKVDLTSWTVNGRIAGLDIIYNGSYSDRSFAGQTDYTGYSNVGPFIPYYICSYPLPTYCGSPVLSTDSFFTTERVVQEARVSTNIGDSIQLIAGVFYDDLKTIERTNYVYPASVNVGFQPNFPIPSAFASDPTARDPGVTFFNDFQRDREELSFFGEISYDITDKLKATFGARHYSIDIGLRGQSSFGSRVPGPESAGGQNVDANLAGQTPAKLDDVIFRGNLSWTPSDNLLFYATYSEGFRGGGFNRNGTGNTSSDVPFYFESDSVENYELGWKTQFLDNRLRFNGAAYVIEFSEIQQGILDFSISNVSFFDNVGSAQIKGFEFDTEWAITEHVTLFGSFTYLDSQLEEIPTTLVNISAVGSRLAFAPEIQTVFGARYLTEIGDYTVFGQVIGNYSDVRFTTLNAGARQELDAFTEFDATLAISKDDWRLTLFVENLTDTLGQVTAGAPDNIFRVVPNRPRTIGLRLGYNY